MIYQAKFQNFKALRDVEITFDSRLTVLVGPNGSGKTSVLQGIGAILLLGSGIPFLEVVKQRELIHLQFHQENLLVLELAGKVDSDGTDAGIHVEFKSAKHRGAPGVTNEDVVVSYRAKNTDQKWMPMSGSVVPVFHPGTLAQLDPALLAQPTYPSGGSPAITPRGEGLASALAGLALNNPDAFQQIVKHLQSIVKHTRGIRFNRYESDREVRETAQADSQLVHLRTRKHITEALLFDFVTARGVHTSEVSDGTLLILGMLALIYTYPDSSILLLDDLDHGLHPKAQMDLIGLLRKLLEEFPKLQIIATSHSPYILDGLEWNEVRVTAVDDAGAAMCAPLTVHPLYERWKKSMSPGEFWSHGGEEWIKQLKEPVAG